MASCQGAAPNPECGPGTQSQSRNCTDGTADKCEVNDISRVVSCAIAGTVLPACSKYVAYMLHKMHGYLCIFCIEL